MSKPRVLILAWLPEGGLAKLAGEFVNFDFVEASDPAVLEKSLAGATLTYGLPPVQRLSEAPELRWIQLISAGVPQELCPIAQQLGIPVTNLAGLYGPSIAEHALAMMLTLSRNLHVAMRNQYEGRWDRGVANTMRDLHGKTLVIVGFGNIGQNIARLARAYGMQIFACRRTNRPAPYVDRFYSLAELPLMLAEADYVAVAAPLTRHTEGMLGPAEFQAMKRGVVYVNVSRGSVAREKALLAALESGQVAAAGLDVFAVEPLPENHPLWSHPHVLISPHYSGETINLGPLPMERFARNLRAWSAGRELEGRVDLEWGY